MKLAKLFIMIFMVFMLVSSVVAIEMNKVSLNNNIETKNSLRAKNIEFNEPKLSIGKKYEVHPSIGLEAKKLEPDFDIRFKDDPVMKTDWDAPEVSITVSPIVVDPSDVFEVEVTARDEFGVKTIDVVFEEQKQSFDCEEKVECTVSVSLTTHKPGEREILVYADDTSLNTMADVAYVVVNDYEYLPDLEINKITVEANHTIRVGDELNIEVEGFVDGIIDAADFPIHMGFNVYREDETEVGLFFDTIEGGILSENNFAVNLPITLDQIGTYTINAWIEYAVDGDKAKETNPTNNEKEIEIEVHPSICNDNLFVENVMNAEGETYTHSFEGVDHEVSNRAGRHGIIFIVNGEESTEMGIGSVFAFNDNSKIEVLEMTGVYPVTYKFWPKPCEEALPDLQIDKMVVENSVYKDGIFYVELDRRVETEYKLENIGSKDYYGTTNIEIDLVDQLDNAIISDYLLQDILIKPGPEEGDWFDYTLRPNQLGEFDLTLRVNQAVNNPNDVTIIDESDYTNNERSLPLTVVTSEDFCTLEIEYYENRFNDALDYLIDAKQDGDLNRIEDGMEELEEAEEDLEDTYEDCGLMYPSFSNYPAFLFENHEFDAWLVVGDNAPAEDVIAVTDIAFSLQDYAQENGYDPFVPAARLASEVMEDSHRWQHDFITVGDSCTNNLLLNMYVDITGIYDPAFCSNPFFLESESEALFLITGLYGKNQVWINGQDSIIRREASRVVSQFESNQDVLTDTRYIEHETNVEKVLIHASGVVQLEDKSQGEWGGLDVELHKTNPDFATSTVIRSTITNDDGEYSFDLDVVTKHSDGTNIHYVVYAKKDDYSIDSLGFNVPSAPDEQFFNDIDLILNTRKKLKFNWVLQPDGSRDFSDQFSLPRGTGELPSWTNDMAYGYHFDGGMVEDCEDGDLAFIDDNTYRFKIIPCAHNSVPAFMEDLGMVDIYDVDQAPATIENYQHDALPGHTYAIKTKENNYALVQIMSIMDDPYPSDLQITDIIVEPNPIIVNEAWSREIEITNTGEGFVKAYLGAYFTFQHSELSLGKSNAKRVINLQPGESVMLDGFVELPIVQQEGDLTIIAEIDKCPFGEGVCGPWEDNTVEESNENNNDMEITVEVIKKPTPVKIFGIVKKEDKSNPAEWEGIIVTLRHKGVGQIAETTTNNVGYYEFNMDVIYGEDYNVQAADRYSGLYDMDFVDINDVPQSDTVVEYNLRDMILHTKKKLIFHWVYQPDGSKDFSDQASLPKGRQELNSDGYGFNFATQEVAPLADVDFFFKDWEPYPFHIGTGMVRSNSFEDLGMIDIWDVTSVPDTLNLGADYADVGHTYAVKTRDDKYAIVQIMVITENDLQPDLEVTEVRFNIDPIPSNVQWTSRVSIKNRGQSFVKAYMPIYNMWQTESGVEERNVYWMETIDLQPGETVTKTKLQDPILTEGTYYTAYGVDLCNELSDCVNHDLDNLIAEERENNNVNVRVVDVI